MHSLCAVLDPSNVYLQTWSIGQHQKIFQAILGNAVRPPRLYMKAIARHKIGQRTYIYIYIDTCVRSRCVLR